LDDVLVGAGSLWLKMRDDAKQAKEGSGQLRLGEFNQSKRNLI
jgi:hypothetical protein